MKKLTSIILCMSMLLSLFVIPVTAADKAIIYTTADKNYFEDELIVTQFGETEVLIENLFNKKENTRVIFNPTTGGIVKIDKD